MSKLEVLTSENSVIALIALTPLASCGEAPNPRRLR